MLGHLAIFCNIFMYIYFGSPSLSSMLILDSANRCVFFQHCLGGRGWGVYCAEKCGTCVNSKTHRTGIAEGMGSNPVGSSEIFLSFIYNCLTDFKTANITFTCILCPQCTHMIFIIYTSRRIVPRVNLSTRCSRISTSRLSSIVGRISLVPL